MVVVDTIEVDGRPAALLRLIDMQEQVALVFLVAHLLKMSLELGEREGLCVDVATEDGAMPKPSRGCLPFCKFQVDRSCP